MISEIQAYGWMFYIGIAYAVGYVFTTGKITKTVPIWQVVAAFLGLFLAIDRGKDSTLFD